MPVASVASIASRTTPSPLGAALPAPSPTPAAPSFGVSTQPLEIDGAPPAPPEATAAQRVLRPLFFSAANAALVASFGALGAQVLKRSGMAYVAARLGAESGAVGGALLGLLAGLAFEAGLPLGPRPELRQLGASAASAAGALALGGVLLEAADACAMAPHAAAASGAAGGAILGAALLLGALALGACARQTTPPPDVERPREPARRGRSAGGGPSGLGLFIVALAASDAVARAAAASCHAGARTPGLSIDGRRPAQMGPSSNLEGARALLATPAGCGALEARARAAKAVLLSGFDARAGVFQAAEWWHRPNIVATLLEYARAFPETSGEIRGVVARVFKKNGCFDFINAYFDDTGWWGLTWAQAFEHFGDRRHLAAAQRIFRHMRDEGWRPESCDGGMVWHVTELYKNAVTNELFFALAARLHRLGAGARGEYLAWAKRSLE